MTAISPTTPVPTTSTRRRRRSRGRLAVAAVALATAGIATGVSAAPAGAAVRDMTAVGIGAQVVTGGVINTNIGAFGSWSTTVSGTRTYPAVNGSWGALQLSGARANQTANAGAQSMESTTSFLDAKIRLPNLSINVGPTAVTTKTTCFNGVSYPSGGRDIFSSSVNINGRNHYPSNANSVLVDNASYTVIGNWQQRSNNGLLAAALLVYSKADSRSYTLAYAGSQVSC